VHARETFHLIIAAHYRVAIFLLTKG